MKVVFEEDGPSAHWAFLKKMETNENESTWEPESHGSSGTHKRRMDSTLGDQ